MGSCIYLFIFFSEDSVIYQPSADYIFVPCLLLGWWSAAEVTAAGSQVSKPGGAGHALLFRNHVILKKDFKVSKSQYGRSVGTCTSRYIYQHSTGS